MGDVADMMLDGTIGEDDSSDFAALRRRRGVHSRMRRADATRDFEQARQVAEENGLLLVRHSESHYQLSHVRKGWLTNIYPGNRRLYGDPNRTGPFLHVHHDWTLLDVVRAAVKVERGVEVGR